MCCAIGGNTRTTVPVPSMGSSCSSQTFLQGQTPVRRHATGVPDANQQRSGAPVARSAQRMDGSAESKDSRFMSNHWRGAGRKKPCGGGRVLHQDFAGIAHVSPGKRRSVGCDAIMPVVKETLGKCGLKICPQFARNMYGAASVRTLITQTDETIPVAPRSSRDRRNRPRRRPPGDSACAAAGSPARATRRRFRRANAPMWDVRRA